MSKLKKLKKFAAKKPEERTIIPRETEQDLPEFHLGEPPEETGEGQLAVDVFQTPEEIIVVAPVAGVNKEDIKINITDDVLRIKGKRGFSWKVEKEDYFHQECFWGNFERSVVLPDDINIKKVKAGFKNGILTIRIPKVEKIREREIEIREE